MKLYNISIEFLSCKESMQLYNEMPQNRYTVNKISPYFAINQNLGHTMEVARDGKRPIIAQKNTCVLFPANRPQSIQFTEGTTFPCVDHGQYAFLDIVINGKYRIDDLYDFPEILPEEYQPEMFLLLQELSKFKETPDTLCDRMSLAYKIIKILLACGIPKKKIEDNVLMAVDYIKRNYKNNISVSELAVAANMSESNFFRIFKRAMSVSPIAYINDYRLLISSVLLETTDKKIGDIAASVGFNEQYYFSKLFSKRFGVSPAIYRKNSRHP